MVGTTSPLIGFIVELNRLPRDSMLLITLCESHKQGVSETFQTIQGVSMVFQNCFMGTQRVSEAF